MRIFRGHFSAFREVATLLVRHRDLTFEMARRDVSDRYVGQAFGMIWAVGHPLFMMAVYVFIFAVVFKQKVGGTIEMPLDYTTYILAGLIPWLSFQESMNKSCAAITGNAGLVKQVVFPIEILPVKGVLASLLPQFVSTALLIVYVIATQEGLLGTYFLLPVLMLMQFFAMLGIGYILSPIGAYFRDIKDFVQLYGIVGMYLMPVFYLPDMVPNLFKPFLYINPFSHLIWCYQDALYFGRFAHPWSWGLTLFFCMMAFVFGYRLFRKLKPGFGNVL